MSWNTEGQKICIVYEVKLNEDLRLVASRFVST